MELISDPSDMTGIIAICLQSCVNVVYGLIMICPGEVPCKCSNNKQSH